MSRRVDFYVDGESRLAFRTLLKAANGSDGIRVRLAFADGTGVDRIFPSESEGLWVGAEWSFADFLAAGLSTDRELVSIRDVTRI